MKISLNWVKEYTNITMPVDKLVERIGARLGEVEGVEDLGLKYKDVLIAKVVAASKHPDADKLTICLLDDGGKTDVERNEAGLITVVCGAPNVRAGLLVAWLPPGATVPATAADEKPFVLAARELRGVLSNGMIASAAELGLSEDHDGILEIETHTRASLADQSTSLTFIQALSDYAANTVYNPGDSFAEKFGLDDVIIDIENKMFTHRPDCFGLLGVAREIAAITGNKFTSPSWYHANYSAKGQSSDAITVAIAENTPVSRLTAQVVNGVKVAPSAMHIQVRLNSVGLRPINNIVDITNYMMHLTGQPLHAFDYDKLSALAGGNKPDITMRISRPDESLTLLNGKTVTLDKPAVVVTSSNVPIALGGIMGGADTEVDSNTTNVVLECATFDMYDIRRSSMHYGIFTDAGNRFNKGQNPYQNLSVLGLAVGELAAQAAGQPQQALDSGVLPFTNPEVKTSAGFINSLLGSSLATEQIVKILENVEFTVGVNGDELAVTAPFWRTDIHIKEDLVEEIGRIYGYDNLELVLPTKTAKPTSTNALLDIKQRIRRILAAAGANETLTYSFVHSDLLAAVDQDSKLSYGITNALSPDLHFYRQSILPSLLNVVNANIRAGYKQYAAFELGKFHTKLHETDGENGLPQEFESLGIVTVGSTEGSVYYTARKYVDNLCAQLGIQVKYTPVPAGMDYPVTKPFDVKRSALVVCVASGNVLGCVGELNASTEAKLKLTVPTAGAEISVSALAEAQAQKDYIAPGKFPSSSQDMTFSVSTGTTYSNLKNSITSILSKTDYSYSLQDKGIYQKDSSTKNISFKLVVSSATKTLETSDVSALVTQISSAAAAETSAQLI